MRKNIKFRKFAGGKSEWDSSKLKISQNDMNGSLAKIFVASLIMFAISFGFFANSDFGLGFNFGENSGNFAQAKSENLAENSQNSNSNSNSNLQNDKFSAQNISQNSENLKTISAQISTNQTNFPETIRAISGGTDGGDAWIEFDEKSYINTKIDHINPVRAVADFQYDETAIAAPNKAVTLFGARTTGVAYNNNFTFIAFSGKFRTDYGYANGNFSGGGI